MITSLVVVASQDFEIGTIEFVPALMADQKTLPFSRPDDVSGEMIVVATVNTPKSLSLGASEIVPKLDKRQLMGGRYVFYQPF
ncbi:hypothetical protein [Bradyrhizobium sp. LB13.1]